MKILKLIENDPIFQIPSEEISNIPNIINSNNI